MSKFSLSQEINEKGSAVLKKVLAGAFFMQEEFGPQDNYPDIDGVIRLRDGKNNNLNKYLHYQLKSVAKLKTLKYPCSKKDIQYLTDPEGNVPTLLFVVDVEKERVFWFYAKKDFHGDLESGARSYPIDLTGRDVADNQPELQKEWAEFARTTTYEQANEALRKVVADFSTSVVNCVGLLYLVQKIPKAAIEEVFKLLLGIQESDSKQIIEKLLQEGVVTGTENLYIVENETVGVESTFELLKKAKPKNIVDAFDRMDDKKIILSRMAEIKHPKTDAYLKELISDALKLAVTPTTNDELYKLLEQIQVFPHRFPKDILKLVKKLMTGKPTPPAIIHKFDDQDLYGKDYEDLLSQGVELLKIIRYFEPKEVFPLLVVLSRNASKTVCSHASNAIKHFAEYNHQILLKIGYGPQLMLAEELEKWGSAKLRKNRDMVLKVCEELLSPSFEGTSWSKNTMTFTSGPLTANKRLRRIRTLAIKILQKLYSTSINVEEKKSVLNYLQRAAATPNQAGATEELYKMIYTDAETLVAMYDSILNKKVEGEIIKEIDEDAYWLGRWYPQVTIKGLKELRLKIASNTEFALFRVFVGYDGHLAREGNLNETKETREEQIQKFADEINSQNFVSWKKKILQVLSHYSPANHGEYIYLGRFLYLFGLKNPDLALRLIDEIGLKLGNWLTHLVAGVYSSDKKEAEKLLKKWIHADKNLTICSDTLGFNHEPSKVDDKILSLILNKANRAKNVEALRSVVRVAFNNYPKNKKLKSLFMSGAESLTALKDTWWLHGIWKRGESLLDNLNKAEATTLLKAMMLLDNPDYHSEEIMASVAEKHPKLIINFFLERISSKANRKQTLGSRFTAIPHDLHGLEAPLRKHENTVVPMVLSWFPMGGEKHNWLYRWEASRFIEKIFPDGFSELLTKHLHKLIGSKDKKNLEIVISILDNYEGATRIWDMCREIIKTYSTARNYKELSARLYSILSDTGAVVGEDGFVRALEAKRAEAETFADEGLDDVKAFKLNYVAYLNQRIEFEKKRVDESLALRDRDLGW